jgi:hypothetical protein
LISISGCRRKQTAQDADDHECFKFSTGNPGAAGRGSGGRDEVNDGQQAKRRVNCFECRHFFITHEPARPYGCEAMGFKSRELPSSVVLRSSGEPCLLNEPKDRLEND